MGLYRMDTLLRRARAQKIALGAFECWDSINIQGIGKIIFHKWCSRSIHKTICKRLNKSKFVWHFKKNALTAFPSL